MQTANILARPAVNYLNLTNDTSTAVDMHNNIILVSVQNVPSMVHGVLDRKTGTYHLTAVYNNCQKKATPSAGGEVPDVSSPIEMNQKEAKLDDGPTDESSETSSDVENQVTSGVSNATKLSNESGETEPAVSEDTTSQDKVVESNTKSSDDKAPNGIQDSENDIDSSSRSTDKKVNSQQDLINAVSESNSSNPIEDVTHSENTKDQEKFIEPNSKLIDEKVESLEDLSSAISDNNSPNPISHSAASVDQSDQQKIIVSITESDVDKASKEELIRSVSDNNCLDPNKEDMQTNATSKNELGAVKEDTIKTLDLSKSGAKPTEIRENNDEVKNETSENSPALTAPTAPVTTNDKLSLSESTLVEVPTKKNAIDENAPSKIVTNAESKVKDGLNIIAGRQNHHNAEQVENRISSEPARGSPKIEIVKNVPTAEDTESHLKAIPYQAKPLPVIGDRIAENLPSKEPPPTTNVSQEIVQTASKPIESIPSEAAIAPENVDPPASSEALLEPKVIVTYAATLEELYGPGSEPY